ncbi:MAG: tRNA (guanosine(37)-N1)-methyltransferase TrmD [Proteobacteria bacterium]|nr:MAG: tRNA (guanosine(37)-N1)-methyltransferase TrmD [Pseudomonadota bacterium]
MKFTFVTLFPELIRGYFRSSILNRALESKLIEIDFYNPRDFTTNKHLKVDDYMVGGGAGLLMNIQPLNDTLKAIKDKDEHAYFIFLTPSAKSFIQSDAKRLTYKKNLVFVCGRYEGFDERVVEKWADEVLSIGDFVLTGGELPALSMCDAISRHIKGVLGNENSLDEESFEDGLLEAPAFSKPNVFEENSVPLEFLKGNHGKITALKNEMAEHKTKFFRPDLYKKSVKRKKYEK